MGESPAEPEREGRAPSTEERLQVAIERVDGLSPPGGWPDRLALAGLAMLLAAVALPWGTASGGQPVVLAQAARPGVFVVGTMVAVVAVIVHVVVARASERGPTIIGLAAGAAAFGTLLVQEADHRPLPLLVPGRVVALVGCVALVGAALSLDESGRVARQRTDAVVRAARRRLAEADVNSAGGDEVVERVAADVLADLPPWPHPGGAWVAGALLSAGVGAVALTGPWWRSAFEVSGPYLDLLEAEGTASTVRSGVEILGTARSWIVAAGVLVAVGTVVWLGGRRAAPFVALAGAVVAASGAAGLGSGQVGRSVVPVLAVLLGAVALVVALGVWWWSSTGPARAASLLVAAPGLLAAWPVEDREVPAAATDGPYHVLAGADAELLNRAFDEVRDGEPAVEVGADDSLPVWVDGLPGVVAWVGARDEERRPVLWVVDDGRVDVRAVGPGPTLAETFPVGYADGTALFQGRGDGARLWSPSGPETIASLPGGAGNLPVLGPGGETWIVTLPYQPRLGEEPSTPGAVHVAGLDELLAPPAERSGDQVDVWPEGPPLPPGTIEVALGDDMAFAVLEDEILALDDDGSTRSVFGGSVDEACGLNGSAAASFVASGRLAFAAEAGGRRGEDSIEVGRRGFVIGYDYTLDEPIVPLWTAEPAADGGLWVALPVPVSPEDEADGGSASTHYLARVTADGAVRVVEHPLPGIRFITVNPDDGTVLLVDYRGRLLQLSDPDAETAPLPPPPDDCYPETPAVALPARLTAIDAPAEPDARLLNAAGTRLLVRSAGSATEIVRLSPDGGEQVVAETPAEPVSVGADGAGGAWWLEPVAVEEDEGEGDVGGDEDEAVDAVPVHLRADGVIDRGPPVPVGTGPFPVRITTYGDSDVPYIADSHRTRPRETDLGIATEGDHRLRRIVDSRVEQIYDAAVDAPVLRDEDAGASSKSLTVTAAGEVVSVDSGEVRRLVGDAFEPIVGGDVDDAADRSQRPLPVHLAAATPPEEIPIDGGMVADPAGDGVLVAQDGLLVRIGLDGTVTALAQDPRLDDVALTVLDGQVVMTDAEGRPFLVETPA